ncbi:MAG TPA: hypothetical protein VLK25_08000, partial [Allosphingosinicella sp.]|nr:hypothetical protein [Allosphingosinicella sp.]
MTPVLALLAALAQPAPAPLLVAEGRVTDASPRGEHDISYAEHRLRLVAGTRYRAIVTAPPQGGFPSRIEIRQGQPIAESTSPGLVDEGEPIPDERLDFVAPRTGDYRLRVYALGYEPRGAYAVRVVALPPLPAPRATPPTGTQQGSWQIWRGTIDRSDPEAILGRHDDYPLEMRAGETWLATVSPDGGARAAGEDGPRFELRIMSADDPDGFALASEDPLGDE